jgi:periplasmic protein TonB
MEAKKNPRVDLKKKQSVFMQIGLLASLSVILLAFEFKTTDPPMVMVDYNGPHTSIEELAPVTNQELPQPARPDIRSILTTFEITDRDDDGDMDKMIWELPPNRPFDPTTWKPRQLTHEKSIVDSFPIIVDVFAKFNGGEEAMYKFLEANLVYPDIAKRATIEGTVYVRFVVEKDGSISRVGMERGDLGGGCEEAAMEAVKKMPNWIPARNHNRPVASTYILPVQFKLMH